MAAAAPRRRRTPEPRLPPTERRNPRTRDLDLRGPEGVVRALLAEETAVPAALAAAAPALARAAEAARAALAAGGRVVYFGAGTSGRLAALDAAEIPPTFGLPAGRFRAEQAGGRAALAGAVEGAEDDADAGAARAVALRLGPRDFVLGVAASGRTPFVLGALRAARARGARTGLLCCDPAVPRRGHGVVVVLDTGPEAVAGSTRLKAGTATKVALNALSTAACASVGLVYDNLMVEVAAANRKLAGRRARIVAAAAGVPAGRARALLAACGDEVKTAIVVALRGLPAPAARALLRRRGGVLRAALEAP
jgi:N-acetylmuramic acid 6-phosphate etherase